MFPGGIVASPARRRRSSASMGSAARSRNARGTPRWRTASRASNQLRGYQTPNKLRLSVPSTGVPDSRQQISRSNHASVGGSSASHYNDRSPTQPRYRNPSYRERYPTGSSTSSTVRIHLLARVQP
ncbi:hypothetical protein PsYK624_154670 [Phanerochaete sordida]|uniref:Uncharacterized protein n=1 Tax=Phanerochaete sordida TaxID=48140 RepID=A0A9P3GQG8_9APHY|nr:hypothetical protein PsYK624_154670 [Phanerochaete sordida]